MIGLASIISTGCARNITLSYDREFGIDIPNPAEGPHPYWRIFSKECTVDYGFNEDLGVEIGTISEGLGHWTTTAYLPADADDQRNLYVMYLDKFGDSLETTFENRTKIERLIKAIPAGNMSVLTVFVTHPETTDANTISYLEYAQNLINQQHSNYASERGWSPIVQFTFTNQTVSSSGFHVSRDTTVADVMDILQREGVGTAGYDFLVLINPDPSMSEGGIGRVNASRPFYIYVGNYLNLSTPLTQSVITAYAATAYHHEVGHYWGWDHDWSTCYDFSSDTNPFITAPALFGWTDTDGDNIPEIIDPMPYGRIYPMPSHGRNP